MSNVLLIDVDSTIPNLALMKLSAYHKSIGDEVGFNVTNPDKVYASVIFKRNRHKTDGLQFFYPDAEINIGGTGYNLNSRIPIPETHEGNGGDRTFPDYSLYDMDYDLGFTSRGCIRNCYFCVVPKKEGKFRQVQHPREFHDPKHRKAVYLDNNILASKDWFFEVTDWIFENDMQIDFNQGLDIRLLTEEVAERLHVMRPLKPWKFAYDQSESKAAVRDGIETLKNAGIQVKNDCLFYVYVHDDSQFEDGLRRCEDLRSWRANPYVMLNMDAPRTQRMTNLKRWCIPQIFWTCEFMDYAREYRSVESIK